MDIDEARRTIERDLAWHQELELKLARAGVAKEDMSDFVNDAMDEEYKRTVKEGSLQLEYDLLKDKYENYKMSISSKILSIYGFMLIAMLLCIGILSNWTYFHRGNIFWSALIIATYPILGIILAIFEVAFDANGGFKTK